ncbi:hypothetical protein DLH72_03765 [Candidatus Gracilibacteria bacterium]|nr:MAG: hypothetical protein DLH72_03765 [Candidatus Gracilibacteria bacterium]
MKANLERIKEMDLEMIELEKDVKFLEETFEKMKEVEKRYKKLEKYYYSDWREDHESGKDLMYGILSEDGLRNIFGDKYELEKNILKFLVKKL